VSDRIGFVGLGVMGKPMAGHLLAAGFELTVHNRSRGPVDELVAAGARAAQSPAEVAAASDVTITMLPDAPDVRSVVAGVDGVLEGADAGDLILDMSTISPVATRELAALAAERGVAWVDAPVSGGDVGAREARLSIMVGGSPDDVARVRPVHERLGTTIVHTGPVGSGQVVKACNQIVVALVIQAVSEALVLGSKAGVSPATIIDVLSGGLAANRVLDAKRVNFLEHRFDPGFRIELHHKDIGIALAAARDLGVPVPATAAVGELLQTLRVCGRGGHDHSAILTAVEDGAAHRIGDGEEAA
jgi:2-hydroxy-3-oxopropionate reductase